MNDMYRHLADRPARNRGTGWRDQAACRDIDPELFFPVGNAGPALLQISRAKQVCAACPARTPCLQWALDSGQEAGVWGGTSEDERRAARYRRMGLAGTGPGWGTLVLRPMTQGQRGDTTKDTPAHLARRTDGRGIDPGPGDGHPEPKTQKFIGDLVKMEHGPPSRWSVTALSTPAPATQGRPHGRSMR